VSPKSFFPFRTSLDLFKLVPMLLEARAEVIQVFRDHILEGYRFRLSKDELDVLIRGFIEDLRDIKAKTRIRALCEAEIKLLEEGYPKASVAKYLSRYRKAITLAIEDGSLPMTKTTSHRYTHQQRVTRVLEERHEHWALTYLKYSNEVHESLDKRQQAIKLDRLSTKDISEVDAMPDEVDAVSVALELPLTVTPDAKASQSTKQSADDKNEAIATEVQRLQDDWRAELDKRVEQLRNEFVKQFQTAKQEHSVAWFVKRIETLEEENLKLRLDQDKAIIGKGSLGQDKSGEIDRLMAENMAIAAELKAVQDKLNAFRQLLNGDAETRGEDHAGVGGDGAIAQTSPQSPQHQIADNDPRRTGTTRRVQVNTISSKEKEDGTTRGTATGAARGPKAGRAFKRAETIFCAVKDWNRLHPAEAFAINPGVMETVFKVHRQAVKELFDAYQNELWDYHQELGVESPRWFNHGKDTVGLKRFVEDWVSKAGVSS
jgi:hypothetical protein